MFLIFLVSVVSISNSWTFEISTIKELSPIVKIRENNRGHSCTQDTQYWKQQQPLLLNHVTQWHRLCLRLYTSLIDFLHGGNLPNGSPVHRVDFFAQLCLWRYVGSVDLVWIPSTSVRKFSVLESKHLFPNFHFCTLPVPSVHWWTWVYILWTAILNHSL